ncbi:Sigma-54 dependent two-component transcriptional regulator [Desulfamplus magnetovallimortis]|uniref:Sigma-54 dependent two-component transcriptional regulator n=1 Tax=Desulfamplus magnetovallimortis TaxID=1246637 RepID=A0A1W1H9X2_9BACT|nr:sigma-54 dependent transcriptional regulator [Desulfamplus magnetovallimortis]SLM29267.1 Sigma-54 dependent two-component transcriptional regulator [Desulfamplus magnetovallimortis]
MSSVMTFCCDDIAGESDAIKDVLNTVRKVSRSDASVLITGESGTGKELVARAIHSNSHRSREPMIVINCGAIPGELLESELFGHEKGAFTGAHRSRTGRFELAHKGTVFLDEIGDMSPDLQVKLLRALQERKIERVGGVTSTDIDIRIISATNKDLPVAISEGIFREDLFYRLNVIPLHVPPLRKRITDLPLLIAHFQNKIQSRSHGDCRKEYSDDVITALSSYVWPGNIRELENLVERLSVMVEGDVVDIVDLPSHITSQSDPFDMASAAAVLEKGIGFNDAVEAYQKALIVHALEQTDWVKARAAEMLKMNRTTLVEKIKKMNIEQEEEILF